jgi:type II secretory pathway predicted ATPase ExeA/pSer/pThr/pTyr-binding forkhead associated (FHA) protein
MYQELFKLHELPFRLSPDPQFLYLSKQHARAKAYMESTIWFTDGFVIITGEIGAGKTTLIETFLRELQADVVVAQINQTQLSPTAFLQTVLVQFGFTPFDMKKPEVLATLNQFLTEQHLAGRKVLLIIDEAQNLSYRVLEEVRMLSGIETTKEKVLRIILAGQPELNDKLNSKDLVQLVQRVRLRFHLAALTAAETTAYIDHRLEVAGSQGRRIFADDTYAVIYRYSGGVPRLINTLCDTSMMAAFGRDSDSVTVQDVEAAVEELQWTEFASRTNRMQIAPMESPQPAQAEVGPPVGRILLASGGKTLLERELRPGRLVIGRTPDNDLQIDSKFISRHHCQIVTQPSSCLIEDLNSTNGIYVKSKRVRRHNLNDGDVVLVGQHEIMYIDERAPLRSRHVSAADDPSNEQEASKEGDDE